MANKEIEKMAKKITDKILREMTYNIMFEIESAYERIVDKFYSDYSTKYYNRTFSIYNASNVYDDYSRGITKTSNGYQIGIRVSSDNISGNPYSRDKEWIFSRAFVEGVHGFSKDDDSSKNFKTIPPKTYPSPKEQMDEWFNEFKSDNGKLQKIKKDAIYRALKK